MILQKPIIIETDTSNIRIDEAISPDRSIEQGFIPDHLSYVIRESKRKITVGVSLCSSGLIVIRNHLPYRIAVKQSHKSIRCVIESVSLNDATINNTELFVSKLPNTKRLDLSTLLQEETDHLAEFSWQIFFFEQQLSNEHQKKFRKDVVEFATTQDLLRSLRFPHGGLIAQFLAIDYKGDHEWQTEYLSKLSAFSQSVAKIESYQGRRLF